MAQSRWRQVSCFRWRHLRQDIEEYMYEHAEKFQCEICLLPMTAPIWLCRHGHSVCCRCRAQLDACPFCRGVFLGARNFMLENIIPHASSCRRLLRSVVAASIIAEETASIIVEEINVNSGNASAASGNASVDRSAHQKLHRCSIKNKNGVFCLWKGNKLDLPVHVSQIHRGCIKYSSGGKYQNCLHVKSNSELTKKVLVKAHGTYFWDICIRKKNRILHLIQHIGSEEEANKYSYSLHVKHDLFPVTMAGKVYPDSQIRNVDTEGLFLNLKSDNTAFLPGSHSWLEIIVEIIKK